MIDNCAFCHLKVEVTIMFTATPVCAYCLAPGRKLEPDRTHLWRMLWRTRYDAGEYIAEFTRRVDQMKNLPSRKFRDSDHQRPRDPGIQPGRDSVSELESSYTLVHGLARTKEK